MSQNFLWGLGRRKSAVARVRLSPGSGSFVVNGKALEDYFPTLQTRLDCRSPLQTAQAVESYDVLVNVHGGGPRGQAGAVRLGLGRALKRLIPSLDPELRNSGHLTRDPRMKERKKFGRRGARRGFQFSKR